MPLSTLPLEQLVAVRPVIRRVWGTFAWNPLGAALLYASVVLLAALTLSPYFAQTWDVATFIQAAHRFTDGGNPADLYAQSRAAQTWPYAYPPLHAVTVALALLIGNILRGLPDYVWARVPALLADVGVGLLLYRIVCARSGDRLVARAAMLLWLFNPILFYNTAVQGHFESEWLLFVLLAYVGLEHSRGILWPTVALAVAVLFKQTAVLFAIPFWAALLTKQRLLANGSADKGAASPWMPVLDSLLLLGFIGVAACLPFLLYSSDFLYMNLVYIGDVPVQTQSWVVGLLGLTRATREALSSDFFLIRYQAFVTIAATLVITWVGQRRRWGLYLTGMLVALAFFLTSKKVMGYYYVMLFPFLLIECLPRRRFDLALITLAATTWISLSPYYAVWGDPDHWWIYALLGSANSVFFLWLGFQMFGGVRRRLREWFEVIRLPWNAWPPLRRFVEADRPIWSRVRGWRGAPVLAEWSQARPVSPAPEIEAAGRADWNNPRVALFVALGLFAVAGLASFLQPLLPPTASPIRAPIVAAGWEWNALIALGALAALSAVMLAGLSQVTRALAPGTIPRGAWGVVLAFVPLFFAVYSLTKESTAIFELVLKTLGA
jgi:hypothetical protein